MNGAVSQLVTLASAANGAISGKCYLDSFYPSHNDFKFCDSVIFVDFWKNRLEEIEEETRFGDPNHWIQHLVNSGGLQVWLTYSSNNNPAAPDHQLSAFAGGGGNWKLVVSMEDTIDYWTSRWEVVNQNAKDDRIWKVTYRRVNKALSSIKPPQPNLDSATSRLDESLNDIHEFACKHDL